jgi:hypothetical protein
MVHSIKAFGLAFASIVVICACAGASAQAVPKFIAGSYPATLTAERVTNFLMTSDLPPVECKQVIGHGTLGATSSTLVLEYALSECTTENGFIGVEIKTNGCKFQFRVLNISPVDKDKSDGRFDIVCPPGKVIEMTVGPACTIKIGSQEDLAPVYFEDLTAAKPEDIRLTVAAGAISYTYAGLVCGSGGSTNGRVEGEVTVKADDTFKNPLALKVE